MSNGKGFIWSTKEQKNSNFSGAKATVIGSGYANTIAIVNVCTSCFAANAAQRYVGGGKTDWFLPSKDELNALYNYGNRDAIGGFVNDGYWSSSQITSSAMFGGSSFEAWLQAFDDGEQATYYIINPGAVRPIRAF
jgi:hypothetical protein